MQISIIINGKRTKWDAAPGDTLLAVLRREGFFGAKSGGCKNGECGACAILLDGKPVNSCSMLAAQADGHSIETIESLGEHPVKGWAGSKGLHPIQQAFVEVGAVQCGYCTPAFILAAKALLDKEPNPTEEMVREAISGVL
ncbi:MAG TPA: (2Fe-2S)-binding protein, partial [Anaerolineaceae bacterium]|nr:(2Fe-2S)-binding protein [Anaerolineaceae bacterium]